jgi:DNA-binding winged helix-turn-helix (wHTH) protein
MSIDTENSKLSFGRFEVNLHTGELWKSGFRIKLQGQPFKVLTALLEKPGQIVTRDELQARIWGKDTVVDFDHSLGTAINKIREALGDSADNPRFVETLARRGYRFIAPVGISEPPSPTVGDPIPPSPGYFLPPRRTSPQASAIDVPPGPRVLLDPRQLTADPPLAVANTSPVPAKHTRMSSLAILSTIVLCTASFYLGLSHHATLPPHITQITHNGHLSPSGDSMEYRIERD